MKLNVDINYLPGDIVQFDNAEYTIKSVGVEIYETKEMGICCFAWYDIEGENYMPHIPEELLTLVKSTSKYRPL